LLAQSVPHQQRFFDILPAILIRSPCQFDNGGPDPVL